MDPWDRIKYRIWHLAAFVRIPGNALSYLIRKSLHWSRGEPELWQESKEGLFGYLGPEAPAAEARARALSDRYGLEPLSLLSTASLYRKALYLLDCLEKAAEGLPPCADPDAPLRAVDVGSQDWHYVFGLERWLRRLGAPQSRRVALTGIEVDGYGIYADFHSRKDYALAYARQTGNPEVRYQVMDFLDCGERDADVVTFFYPFVTRYALLLWGLPLWHFAPARMVEKAASITRPGGWLVVFNQTSEEQALFLGLGRASGRYELLREGRAWSNLVDFHAQVEDRRFSIWRRMGN